MRKLLILSLLGLFGPAILISQTTGFTQWHYVQLDDNKGKWGDDAEPPWLRYFGLDMGDVDADGYLDVVSGRYIYHNPGGDMTGSWERTDLGQNVDGLLFMDVDGDEYADVIAQGLPDVYWLEATDTEGKTWKSTKIGQVPATSHVNSQGFERGQIIAGGKEEFVIAGDGDIYLFQIPDDPDSGDWPISKVGVNTSDEGIGLGDVDGDGLMDIAAGRRPDGGDEPLIIVWFKNPGSAQADWPVTVIGQTNHPADRVEVADVNGDGRSDIIVSEERYPGLEADASMFWYENKAGDEKWPRHVVVTQYSMNNLDVADYDNDGDIDLLTAEHKGQDLELQWWVNDGSGQFSKQLIDTGKENHLGTQVADLDGDGDLDIVGAGWDQSTLMHMWRNDYVDNRFTWKHLSTTTGDLPPTNGGTQQTASLVTDLNNDGINDILITDRTVAPAVIALIYSEDGWERILVEDGPLRIEAGSTAHDIDGDGDMDVVFGGEGQSNEVWWWENPYPNIDSPDGWTRHIIKNTGGNKHHDQAFIDYDGDGTMELVFWCQGDKALYAAEIPSNPRTSGPWERQTVYTYNDDGEMSPRSEYPTWRRTNEHEGLFAADMDDDGVDEIVGGGRWFDYQDGKFVENIVDAAYTFTRSVAGQLIEGGRPEIVMSIGDGVGPLVMYEWRDGFWMDKTLVDGVDNGHTLDILDFDGDGHLDIFNAEMRFEDGNPDSEVRIFLGDGKGNFSKHVVARGFAVHEGRLVDLDGDGDLDVLGKPYTKGAPRLDIWLQE